MASKKSIFDSFKTLVVDKHGNFKYVENNNPNNLNLNTMATKKSTAKKVTKKATTKKATKKVASKKAPKVVKHLLSIEALESKGDVKASFKHQGNVDILAMSISKQAHENDEFRAFFYYLINGIAKYSEVLLKKSKANKSKGKSKWEQYIPTKAEQKKKK